MNQLTSDPIALGGLVTDPKNEIAQATGFLLSVSRFLADISDTLGRRRVVWDVGNRGGVALVRVYFLFHV